MVHFTHSREAHDLWVEGYKVDYPSSYVTAKEWGGKIQGLGNKPPVYKMLLNPQFPGTTLVSKAPKLLGFI